MSSFLLRRNLAGLRSARWADTLAAYNVTVLPALPATPRRAILVTGCSRKKKNKADFPQYLYLGQTIKRVFNYAEQHEWPFGVLSDRYGVCFSTDIVEPYDTAPADLTEQQLWDLGESIGERFSERGYRAAYYVGGPPSMILPYMIMLLASGTRVFYCPWRASTPRGTPRSLLDHV